MEEREIKEKIENGYLLSRVIIEIVGKPKEHVEKALTGLLDHMHKNKDVIIVSEHKEEAKEVSKPIESQVGCCAGDNPQRDKEIAEKDSMSDMWNTFAEIEVMVKGLPKLIVFCFDYMPSSVEILEPAEFKFKEREVSGFLNEMQAKLHNLGVVIKNLKNENMFLKKNSSNLLLNHLNILLVNKKRTIEDLSKLTGISEKELKPFIEKLTKDGKIKEEDGAYTFAK